MTRSETECGECGCDSECWGCIACAVCLNCNEKEEDQMQEATRKITEQASLEGGPRDGGWCVIQLDRNECPPAEITLAKARYRLVKVFGLPVLADRGYRYQHAPAVHPPCEQSR